VAKPGQRSFPKPAAWSTITFQLRHTTPKETDLARTSFKATIVLTSEDALSIARELLTAAAVKLKPKV
jgi:uncharacterized protein YciW